MVGTEFEQQSLLSKQIDVIYSNPPYSEFVPWTVKILREAAAHRVYLVVPVRWRESLEISEAIKFRDAKTHVLGEYSFEDAEDRAARARVNLIRVQFSQEKGDAFERFFNEQFGHLKERFEARRAKNKEREPGQEKQSPFASLVVGENYPEAMVGLYNAAMAKIQRNYEAVGNLDVELLAELGVEPEKIMAGLKQRLEGLRNLYWQEIFGRMSAVTDRLTSKKRRLLLDTLNRHAHVDFTVDNIYAVILWVIKNANEHLDAQLVETFEQMVEKANVKLYRSNERPFVWDRWRYRHEPTDTQSTHFALEYRIVLQHVGGVRNGEYSFDRGLEERAADFLGDLLTVARNLGFQNNTADWRLHGHRESWQSNQKEEFRCINPVTKNSEVLLEVRAFKNGNCHVRMHQRFALALNVEYGRLKGWLHSGTEAADELREQEAAGTVSIQPLLADHRKLDAAVGGIIIHGNLEPSTAPRMRLSL